MILNIKDNFTKELPSDPILENSRRQVTEAVFSYVNPKKTKDPKVIHTSIEMANELGLSADDLKSEFFNFFLILPILLFEMVRMVIYSMHCG